MVAALGAGTGAARVILIACIISNNGHLNGVSKFYPIFPRSLVHQEVKASEHDFFFQGNLKFYTLTLMGTVLGLLK